MKSALSCLLLVTLAVVEPSIPLTVTAAGAEVRSLTAACRLPTAMQSHPSQLQPAEAKPSPSASTQAEQKGVATVTKFEPPLP